MQLCYEGAVGSQAYGKVGYSRRARGTQVSGFGRGSIRSWKGLDDGSVVDEEVLWEGEGETYPLCFKGSQMGGATLPPF